jgi:hypothetical protein
MSAIVDRMLVLYSPMATLPPESCYPTGRHPEPLGELGEFSLPDPFDPAVTFDPWPGGYGGTPGYIGYQVSRCPSAIPSRPPAVSDDGTAVDYSDSLFVIEADEVSFDHGRTGGKCRFASGRVVFIGDRTAVIAYLTEHGLPPALSDEPRWPEPSPLVDRRHTHNRGDGIAPWMRARAKPL